MQISKAKFEVENGTIFYTGNRYGYFKNATAGCLHNDGNYYGEFLMTPDTEVLLLFEKRPEYETIDPTDTTFILSTDYDMMYSAIEDGNYASTSHDLCYWMK